MVEMGKEKYDESTATHDLVIWNLVDNYVKTPEATPISLEEIKNISAMYDASQTTKIASITNTELSEYKDMKIYRYLNDSHEGTSASDKCDESTATHDLITWNLMDDYVKTPKATPINIKINPEEVKDIFAMYAAHLNGNI
jgi:hypothetical protein